MNVPLADRTEAGRQLAAHLLQLRLPQPIVVLALPRGGVPVGAEIARALGAAFDLVLVRKIGAPGQPELALAAVVEGDPPDIAIDLEVQRITGVDDTDIARRARLELREIARRRQLYLRGRAPVDVTGCTTIVVDDGIATGTTMRAALKALRRRRPARLLLAVPVAPRDTLAALRPEVDQIVCLAQPYPFRAVGTHYLNFDQLDDDEVIAALASADASAPRLTPK
ncbi:MAG: phosphoribosyltransferase family protein [Burkholderiaceae bacterium]